MTTDTSREAVEALIRQQANAACGIGANVDPMMLIFTLRALLDERDRLAANRDAWVSDAMTSTTELEQRIRDLEAAWDGVNEQAMRYQDELAYVKGEALALDPDPHDAEWWRRNTAFWARESERLEAENARLTAKLDAVRSWFDEYNGFDPGVGGWYALEVNLDEVPVESPEQSAAIVDINLRMKGSAGLADTETREEGDL